MYVVDVCLTVAAAVTSLSLVASISVVNTRNLTENKKPKRIFWTCLKNCCKWVSRNNRNRGPNNRKGGCNNRRRGHNNRNRGRKNRNRGHNNRKGGRNNRNRGRNNRSRGRIYRNRGCNIRTIFAAGLQCSEISLNLINQN